MNLRALRTKHPDTVRHRPAAFLLALLVCLVFALPAAAAPAAELTLTEEESAYLAAHPTVSIAMDESWTPYAFHNRESGKTDGILPTLLELAASRVGLTVEYVGLDSYAAALAAVQSGQTDLVSGIAQDTAMAEKNHLAMTDPYLTIYYTAITARDQGELYAEGADSRVAVCVGSYSTMAMRAKMPGYTFVEYNTNAECIDAVQRGEVDMALVASYAATHYMGRYRYRNLSSVQIAEFSWGLCFGAGQGCDPALLSLLNKGIATLTDNDVNQAIYRSQVTAARLSRSPVDWLSTQPFYAISMGILFLLLLAVIVILWLLQAARKKQLGAERALNEALEKENREVRRAEREKMSFYARMSHDMRTPLNAIIGFSDESLVAEADDATRVRYLNRIHVSGQYLLGIINDVLDMSKIATGKVTLNPQVYPLEEFEQIIDSVIGAQCRSKGVNFHFASENVPPEAAAIYVDKTRFNQIFINLLSNAVKFTPTGGTVEFLPNAVLLPGGRLRQTTTVRDTGCGMSAEFLVRAFEPFTQEHRPGTDAAQGTGLGLTIVKQIVDLMGGSITVESELGRGTTFVVKLDVPVAPLPAQSKTAPAPLPQGSYAGKRILLCEDHPLNTEIARALLVRRGFVVDCAENGQLGLEMFRRAAPGYYSLILMDIRMPVMDGLAAAAAIRALEGEGRPDAATIPILAMTANAYDEDIQKSFDAGMNAHLAKPIEPALLYDAIQNYLPLSADASETTPS